MHDAALVRMGHRIDHLQPEPDDIARRQPRRAQPSTERLAVHQLHRDVEHPLPGADGRYFFRNVVDGADMRMIQLRRQPRLSQQARPGDGVGQSLRGKHLQGGVSVEPLVVRSVDNPHPARADLLEDEVVAQPAARRQ